MVPPTAPSVVIPSGFAALTSARSTSITLPAHLRGYVKYLVVVHPLDGRMFSLGIKHVCQSEGAREVLQRLADKRVRKHRKPLHAALCLSTLQGTICPMGWGCPHIHCTTEGFAAMRTWNPLPPAKITPRTPPFIDSRSATGSPEVSSRLSIISSISTASEGGVSSLSSQNSVDGVQRTPSAPIGSSDTVVANDLSPSPARSPDGVHHPSQSGQLALQQSLARLRQRAQRLYFAKPQAEGLPARMQQPRDPLQWSVCEARSMMPAWMMQVAAM